MDSSIIRALVALLLALVFWMQARGVRDQPKRRRAFELLGVSDLSGAARRGCGRHRLHAADDRAADDRDRLDHRAGEMRGQVDRVAQAAQEYRERREAERSQKQ